jgi:hypothetical protein
MPRRRAWHCVAANAGAVLPEVECPTTCRDVIMWPGRKRLLLHVGAIGVSLCESVPIPLAASIWITTHRQPEQAASQDDTILGNVGLRHSRCYTFATKCCHCHAKEVPGI